VIDKQALKLPAGREASRGGCSPQYKRHRTQQTFRFQGSIPAQSVSTLIHCTHATGYRLAWKYELAGEMANAMNQSRWLG
jgi:hypothetical protein